MGYLDDIIEGKNSEPSKQEEKQRARFLTRYFLGLIGGLSFIAEWDRAGRPPTLARIKKDYGYESSEMITACEQGMFEGMGLTYRGRPDEETSELTYGLTYRGQLLLETFKEIWPLLEMASELRRKKENGIKKAKRTRVGKVHQAKGVRASRK